MPYQSQNTTDRPLRVFLCHSSNDKPAVRELYQKLRAEPWIQPWLDEEELYPGQDWNMEIEKAVVDADAIIVCLSKGSITKEGYIQRELRTVLDFADYKPEGTLYIIPVRLEECEPPRRLRAWQYADYFEGQRERAFERLLINLKRRADSLGINIGKATSPQTIVNPKIELALRENQQSKIISKSDRALRVFLCYTSSDKFAVRELYNALNSHDWIDPWLDKMKILPGQNWRMVIEEAVEESDIAIICLSGKSVNKEGFIQREIRYAYDLALEKPDGLIFLIPLRLEECEVPRGMRSFQWVDYFGVEKEEQHLSLIESLKLRLKQKNRL